jgi:hypothetical protein
VLDRDPEAQVLDPTPVGWLVGCCCFYCGCGVLLLVVLWIRVQFFNLKSKLKNSWDVRFQFSKNAPSLSLRGNVEHNLFKLIVSSTVYCVDT